MVGAILFHNVNEIVLQLKDLLVNNKIKMDSYFIDV